MLVARFLLLLTLCIIYAKPTFASTRKSAELNINVEDPEVYELANVILSLTKYGRTDRNEINKEFPYYSEVITSFAPYMSHPLLDLVNYSRKRWDEFLAFRTDAYAFSFNAEGKIQRMDNFYSMGKIRPFDKYLPLIQDFANKSHFRTFYTNHKSFYNDMRTAYTGYYRINDIVKFLSSEFKHVELDKRCSIVISALVGRMNCVRPIGPGHSGIFVPVAEEMIKKRDTGITKDEAIEIHTLFTEIDYLVTSPLSDKYERRIIKKFDENLWDDGSGYAGYQTAVFDEYMTWSIYDIFTMKMFPQYAGEINLYWQMQNEMRGFKYAYNFSQELQYLYQHKTKKQTITDFVPALLDWCSKQNNLTKPVLTAHKDSITIRFANEHEFQFSFSEAMKKVNTFNALVVTPQKYIDSTKGHYQWHTDTLLIDNIKWINDSTLSITVAIRKVPFFYITLNDWGTALPLKSAKETLLREPTRIKVKESVE